MPDKDKYYLMHYVKESNFFNVKKLIIISLSLITASVLLFFIFFNKTNKEEITIKNTKIIIKKDTDKKINVKSGEFKKDDVILDGNKYIKYVYIVQKNDTLWKIAEKFLNDSHAWQDIPKYNENIKDPHWIIVGEQIIIYIPKN